MEPETIFESEYVEKPYGEMLRDTVEVGLEMVQAWFAASREVADAVAARAKSITRSRELQSEAMTKAVDMVMAVIPPLFESLGSRVTLRSIPPESS